MIMKTVSYLAIYYILLALTTNHSVLCEETQNSVRSPASIFPDLFKMDDYYKCPERSSYCTSSLKLIAKSDNSTMWKQLETWSTLYSHYNRTVIYRSLCVPQQYNDRFSKIKFIESNANEELARYDLSAKLYDINCMEENFKQLNIKMYIIGSVLYLGLILTATIYDTRWYDKNKENILKKFLICFSLLNYNRSSITKTEEYQRLKGIQGIRTYQTLIVITGHSIMYLLEKFIKNTEFVEMVFSWKFVEFSLVSSMWIVQIYFIISSWLMTLQIFMIYEKHGRFTIKDAGLIFVHRIARIWPMLVVNILSIPVLFYVGYGPGTFHVYNLFSEACSKNWWVTFAFATNLLRTYQTCHPGLWSIAIDTHIQLLAITFLYFVLNFKLNLKKGLAVLFLVSYFANVVIIVYTKDFNGGPRADIKSLTNLNIMYDEKFEYNYFGFWSCANSGVLGILFGYLYFLNRNNGQKIQPLEKWCGPIVVVLPLASGLAGYPNYSLLATAFILPLVKVTFLSGIAVGIYGMSRNIILGFIKSICENKYAMLFGNFTYCTYICHFYVVFKRKAHLSEPIEMSFIYVISSTVEVIIISFILGIIMTLTIELPFLHIKKLILPPVWQKTKPSNDITVVNKDK